MPGLSEARLGHAQDFRESTFHDIVQVQVRSVERDPTTGQPTEVWVDSVSFYCSVRFTSPQGESHEYNVTQVDQDAVIRFPRGTEFSVTDNLKLTYRYGLKLDTPIVFQVKGEQALDLLAGRVAVKKISS